jgi:hypothetical protein
MIVNIVVGLMSFIIANNVSCLVDLPGLKIDSGAEESSDSMELNCLIIFEIGPLI